MSSAPEFTLPVLSLSLLSTSEGRERLGSEFRAAAQGTGFLQIVDHGVSQGLIQNTFEVAERFFDLPLEEKLKLSRDLLSHRGYELIGVQSLEGSLGSTEAEDVEGLVDHVKKSTRFGDQKEGMMIGDDDLKEGDKFWGRLGHGENKLPEDGLVPGMREVCQEYYTKMRQLSRTMMGIVATSIGSTYDECFAKETMADALITLRLLHYPPTEVKDTTGIGAHTDFGLITLLATSGTPGLELWYQGGWHSVEPVHGAFVLNIGDSLSKIIPGYKSSLHRVINKSGKHRYSLPLFVEGNLDFVVKPMNVKEEDGEWLTVEETLNERFGSTYK